MKLLSQFGVSASCAHSSQQGISHFCLRETCLLSVYRRLQTGLLWATTTSGFLYLLGSLDDGEDEVEVAKSVKQVTAVATKNETLGGSEVEEQPGGVAQGLTAEEAGNEIEVPEEPPEDSWFIPLGWARQRPQTFYKGHDPEWQSFVQFSQNAERSILIRSLLPEAHAFNEC